VGLWSSVGVLECFAQITQRQATGGPHPKMNYRGPKWVEFDCGANLLFEGLWDGPSFGRKGSRNVAAWLGYCMVWDLLLRAAVWLLGVLLETQTIIWCNTLNVLTISPDGRI
jgi:hypothetical protein